MSEREATETAREKVDRVAKAIHDVTAELAGNQWGDPDVRANYERYARAAIKAMPEPVPDPRDATIARLSAELEEAREAPKHIEQMTRSLAVELVDGIKEYTMEFSASPRAHRAEYDLVEQKLSEFARAVAPLL